MPNILKQVSKLSLTLTFSAGIMASPVLAQSNSGIASACIQAIEEGDTETAKELATRMMERRNLFSLSTIKNAEQCLQTVTGIHWKYFTTKGRFLSGGEARAEQAYIDGADDRMDDRRSAQEENLKRWRCEATIAKFELEELEEDFKKTKEARTIEAFRATLNACTQVYIKDQGAALLNPVCADVFKNVGIPDTEYVFDYTNLEVARLKMAVSEINLWRVLNRTPKKTNTAISLQIKECKKLLAE